MTNDRPPATSRTEWIDGAKGAAILLVVLAHAQTELAAAGLGLPMWDAANQALTTLRMPTFFLLSGIFARKALFASRGQFGWDKLARFTWLYLVWSTIYLVLFSVCAAWSGGDVTGVALGWLVASATGDGPLWYLVGLATFFFIARCCRRASALVQILAAGVMAALFLSDTVTTSLWGPDHMARYLVFFLIGCYGSSRVRDLVAAARLRHAIVLGSLWLAGCGTAALTGGVSAGGVALPLVAVPFALAAVRVLDRREKLSVLPWLGRTTLPIYVLHPGTLLLLAPLAAAVPWPSFARLILPVLLAGLAVILSLASWVLMRRVPGLFDIWPIPTRFKDAKRPFLDITNLLSRQRSHQVDRLSRARHIKITGAAEK